MRGGLHVGRGRVCAALAGAAVATGLLLLPPGGRRLPGHGDAGLLHQLAVQRHFHVRRGAIEPPGLFKSGGGV